MTRISVNEQSVPRMRTQKVTGTNDVEVSPEFLCAKIAYLNIYYIASATSGTRNIALIFYDDNEFSGGNAHIRYELGTLTAGQTLNLTASPHVTTNATPDDLTLTYLQIADLPVSNLTRLIVTDEDAIDAAGDFIEVVASFTNGF